MPLSNFWPLPVVDSKCGQKHPLNSRLNPDLQHPIPIPAAKAFWAQVPIHTRRGIDLRDREA